MLIDRQPQSEPARLLPLRLGAFFVAAALFAAGVLLEMDALVIASAAVAVAGWLLRFAGRRARLERHPDWDEPQEPAEPR